VPPTIVASTPSRLTVEIVKTYPHSRQAYTEGLVFFNGTLWESTGINGESQLRQLVLSTGEEIASRQLDAEFFGEGLARHGNQLVQLTLSSEQALVWDLETLEQVGNLSYRGEGWGLCHDGKQFVVSNGTSLLQIRDSNTFALLREIEVRMTGTLQFTSLRLNELECFDHDVLANVLAYREIVRINLESGEITEIIDTRNLLLNPHVSPEAIDGALDLNGIAYVPETGNHLLTGKYWPLIFEVRFVEDPLFR
jgi:glutaminyl-peptide cyclotransferase